LASYCKIYSEKAWVFDNMSTMKLFISKYSIQIQFNSSDK